MINITHILWRFPTLKDKTNLSRDFSCLRAFSTWDTTEYVSLIITRKRVASSAERSPKTPKLLQIPPVPVSSTFAHHICHLLNLPARTQKKKTPKKFVKTRAQFGTGVSACAAPRNSLRPRLLSMMQLFHLVALFSRFTFVLLSAVGCPGSQSLTSLLFLFIRSLDSSLFLYFV